MCKFVASFSCVGNEFADLNFFRLLKFLNTSLLIPDVRIYCLNIR